MASGGAILSYDLNGNLASDGTTSYMWNARNQLVGLSGGTSASFQYDALGRRRGKTVGGTTTNFLHDGLNLVQELTGGGTPTANLLAGLGLDETFARTDGGGTSTLLADALGSTLALTNNSGSVQTQYTVEPFGATTTSGATSTNAAQFTGRENDGTRLYYYRARYYHPQLQRFISEDPMGSAGGLNLFAYAANAPTANTDPLGLKPDSGFGDDGDTGDQGGGEDSPPEHDENKPCDQASVIGLGVNATAGANLGLGIPFFGGGLFFGMNLSTGQLIVTAQANATVGAGAYARRPLGRRRTASVSGVAPVEPETYEALGGRTKRRVEDSGRWSDRPPIATDQI